MAKGGGRRNYTRDANGRFSSTPGGGGGSSLKAARKKAAPSAAKKPMATGGTLPARSKLKEARAKLAAKDSADPTIKNSRSRAAQKGAVTKSNKALRTAKEASQKRMGGMKGVIGKSKGLKPGELAARRAANSQVAGSTTPAAPPSAPKRKRMKGAGNTVAKPKGLKPGALAARRAAKEQAAQAAAKTRQQAAAKPAKKNRFLDPIARRILIATGQLKRN